MTQAATNRFGCFVSDAEIVSQESAASKMSRNVVAISSTLVTFVVGLSGDKTRSPEKQPRARIDS